MITEIGSRLRITNPSPDMVDWCKKHLEIPNPEYQKKARMNLWLGDTPRILVMYEVDGDSVIIPFGCLRSILPLLEGDVKKLFAEQVKVDYKGAKVPLYDYQEEAVGAMIIKYDMKIGNQAAYAAIGIDKGIAWEWVNRCTTNPARTDFIKKVQKVCALYREGLMQDGKVNPVTGIFWQKNYDGMKDQTEMVLTPNNPLGDSADTEALARKYLDNADIVDVPEGEISEVAERAESPKIK